MGLGDWVSDNKKRRRKKIKAKIHKQKIKDKFLKKKKKDKRQKTNINHII